MTANIVVPPFPVFQSSHWKEALKILKLAVSKSSTLVAPLTSSGISYHWETASGSNFAETDMYFKKELPGIN